MSNKINQYLFILSILVLLGAPLFGASGIFVPQTGMEWDIFLSLRIPRVILGFIVGGGLAMTGAVLQSFFRNDLASPFTLGIASTASFGAAIALFLGFSGIMIELSAVMFSLAAMLFLLGVYKSGRVRDLPTLLLAGLAFGLLSSSGIYFLQYLGGAERSFEIYRWLAGGLEITSYEQVMIAGLILLIVSVFIFRNIPALDLMQVSSEFAKGRGVAVREVSTVIILTTSILTGSFVAICGPIGFIGLVIPHVGRRMLGSSHREFLPFVLLLGGVFLVLLDTISRTVFAPIEIPVGILTSLLGAPCFIYILLFRK